MNFFKLFINYLLIKEQGLNLNNYRINKNKFLLNYNTSITPFSLKNETHNFMIF
jgi:hypothetical protein